MKEKKHPLTIEAEFPNGHPEFERRVVEVFIWLLTRDKNELVDKTELTDDIDALR